MTGLSSTEAVVGTPQPHPDVTRVVGRFEAAGVEPYEIQGVIEARHALAAVTRLQKPPPRVAVVRDVLVPGPQGLLPARVYNPDPSRPLPVVLYLHGGGWVLGGVREADGPCRRLALVGHCVVLSLEYRLAPETKFPGPVRDCVTAARWVGMNASDFGGDPKRFVLAGDSAGANLAAATAIALRDEAGPPIAAQLLMYPCLSPAKASPFGSYRQFADGPLNTRASMEWFWQHYLRDDMDGADPLAAPLCSSDLSGLPPATVVVAELDVLRDEGLAYAERMRRSGTEATTSLYRGAAHGFWWMDAAMQQADELTAQLGAVIRDLPPVQT